jgi:Spy/CpxP family protein refolding chaperone
MKKVLIVLLVLALVFSVPMFAQCAKCPKGKCKEQCKKEQCKKESLEAEAMQRMTNYITDGLMTELGVSAEQRVELEKIRAAVATTLMANRKKSKGLLCELKASFVEKYPDAERFAQIEKELVASGAELTESTFNAMADVRKVLTKDQRVQLVKIVREMVAAGAPKDPKAGKKIIIFVTNGIMNELDVSLLQRDALVKMRDTTGKLMEDGMPVLFMLIDNLTELFIDGDLESAKAAAAKLKEHTDKMAAHRFNDGKELFKILNHWQRKKLASILKGTGIDF